MSERSVEFKVGLLILTALVLFAGLIFILGNFTFGSGYTLYVDYNFSGNIRSGAPVKLSGIKVGKVDDVMLMGGKVDPETGRRIQVRLEIWVEERVKDTIRQDAEFFINTAGVLGEQYLEIVPGDDYERGPIEPDAVIRGVDPPRTDLIISRLYLVLDSLSKVLTEDRDLIRNLLKDGANSVKEINALLTENRQQMGELITSANDLASEAAVTLNKFNTGIGDPRIIGQTVRHADLLLVSAENAVSQLTPGAKVLVSDAARVTGLLTAERLDRALAVADGAISVTGKASKLVDNVDGMVTDLRKGKGTAGALLVREELYADLREMIRDLKRNPWKFFWKE